MSGEKRKYDERQALSRARAGQMAFWMLAAMVSAGCLLREILGRPWATPLAEEAILIFPPLTVWRVRCIWTDSDDTLNERQRHSWKWYLAGTIMCTLLGIGNIDRSGVLEDGMLSYGWVWVPLALGYLALVIAMLLRRRKDRREEAEE